MKKLIPAILAATLAIAPAFADYSEDLHLTEDEWWQKEGFFNIQAFYAQYKVKDIGKAMQGGGFGFGGEYVSPDLHFGYGGMLSFAFDWADYTGYKASHRLLLNLDFDIPVRISNTLTAYAGAGATMHGLDLEYDKGWGWGYEGNVGSGEEWENSGAAITESAFVGFRWRFFEHTYLFCEYRREFGKIDMECTNWHYADGRKWKKELDMSGNRILAGVGLTF